MKYLKATRLMGKINSKTLPKLMEYVEDIQRIMDEKNDNTWLRVVTVTSAAEPSAPTRAANGSG